ncbi:extracellular serine-rich protein [Niveomyces insectorum RCEF 264]|uniref:Extracellular serine-rich protein n=1 Tax=Niveomyces insectorum RCEF 264 TaxID=1081102 RepID=A0A167T9G5_9HYPO|nr:extracellular serine-rich protein [Niveomyces insectorum RCEF 264]
MFFVRLLSLAAAVTAATIEIDVGKGGLAFSPDTVTAAKGDILEFHFVGGYHDAVKGDPAKPCTPLAGGFASATEAGSATNKNIFRVTVNDTNPIYYYCSVGAHCANGMVAVVNPTADDTAAAFKAAAKSATAVRPVGAPYGGEMTTTD